MSVYDLTGRKALVTGGARGLGAGKALLRRLAQRCMDADLGRLEWSVLNWNTPAIEFYDSLNAAAMEEWTVRRLYGEALHALAADSERDQRR